MTTAPPAKRKKVPPAAASLPTAKAVGFQPFQANSKKRDVASLELLSPEQVKTAALLQGVLDEDELARSQLFGQLGKDSLGKDTTSQENGKLPAQEEDNWFFLEDNDDDEQDLRDPDAYFAAEEAAHLARTQKEVRQFMENDNVPLQPTLAHAQRQQQQQQVLEGLLDDDWNNDRTINANPNTTMRDNFRAYCAEAKKHFMPDLTKSQKRAIKLLHVLKSKKSPLDTFDMLMEWHFQEKGDIQEHQGVGDLRNYISRNVIMDTIKERCNMASKFPINVDLKLPVSNARVKITKHSAWDCIESLLTDPRVEDDDYNFVDEDPFAPPRQGGPIGDFHTARAHKEAYDKYITDPTKQILMPFQMYIDGACTGQFNNLPVTALKVALGIHTRKYRDKEHAWRTLGYVSQVSKANSRGKAIFAESGHMEAEVEVMMEGEGQESPTTMENKAQDFHAMLEEILKSYLEVQENGFIWDLRYRGRTYKDVEFVPYVVFIKCDTEEGDLLCGKFLSRNAGVKNLCRYCTCPTQECDLVNAKFPLKTVSMIMPSILIRDQEGLTKISQHCIDNAWYKVRFSPESSRGIHGATPSEMLHAVLLGIFKYTRDMFFEQTGNYSQVSDEMNALAQKYGVAFGRQSGRDLPKCKFKQGIRKGKLQAKEFRGILLVMAALLRSEKGVAELKKNKRFANDFIIKDWLMLVEMLLEWEAFLCEPEMSVHHVMRLQKKNRYLMYLFKKIGDRAAGMGLKLTKFHVITHLAWDIMLFGVPMEVDTGFNESHHKLSKVAAHLTQKNEETFNFQTATRLDEFYTIDLAMEEVKGRSLFDYYTKPASTRSTKPTQSTKISTGGVRVWVYRTDDTGREPCYCVGRRMKKSPSSIYWGLDIVGFLVVLQEKLVAASLLSTGHLEIRSEHRRNGDIFRGCPQYRDNFWRDWALFEWGNQSLPGQIWCFIVIDCMKAHPGANEGDPPVEDPSGVDHGGMEVQNGVYAVVEFTDYATDRKSVERSDLFIPVKKRIRERGNKNRRWKRGFWLVDTNKIVKPLTVIPNIGAKSGRDFFVVKQRSEWAQMFRDWLDDPPEHDVIGDDEPVPSHIVDNTL